jgi:hypothetical protein
LLLLQHYSAVVGVDDVLWRGEICDIGWAGGALVKLRDHLQACALIAVQHILIAVLLLLAILPIIVIIADIAMVVDSRDHGRRPALALAR